MRDPRRRMLPLLLGAPALFAPALPASAGAHGIVGKADLPIPVWLFSWTAAIVLVVSFVALSTLWRTPQLQVEHRRRLRRSPRSAHPPPSLRVQRSRSGWRDRSWLGRWVSPRA